jgi:transposase InsO family protein
VALRREHPTWGPRKLIAVLEEKKPGIKFPTHATVSKILARHDLVTRRPRRHRPVVAYSPVAHAVEPNDVWCIDYKGQFRLGDGTLCYPLTLTDACSRFILACEAFPEIDGADVKRVLELVFRELGLPSAMRFDGGAPFASNALWGWSQLSVWLLRLGIRLEQIEPASPQQNGRHERMHRTLKAETTRPAAANLLQQQERFDRFVEIFNKQRPHEALGQKPPASVYRGSKRVFPESLPEVAYPLHDFAVRVGDGGHIRFPGGGRRMPNVFISGALRGELVGLRELEDDVWLVSFLSFDIGEFDLKTKRFNSYPPPIHATSRSEGLDSACMNSCPEAGQPVASENSQLASP